MAGQCDTGILPVSSRPGFVRRSSDDGGLPQRLHWRRDEDIADDTGVGPLNIHTATVNEVPAFFITRLQEPRHVSIFVPRGAKRAETHNPALCGIPTTTCV